MQLWHIFVLAWQQGASRVVTARELSLKEIGEIRKRIPADMEIESVCPRGDVYFLFWSLPAQCLYDRAQC